MSNEQKYKYAVIVYLQDQKKPKKWEYVEKLNGFAMFLNQKFPTWAYMNVYDRTSRQFLKQFRNGHYIPAFL